MARSGKPRSQSPSSCQSPSLLGYITLTLSLTSVVAAAGNNVAQAGKQVGFAPNWKALREGNFRPSFHGAPAAKYEPQTEVQTQTNGQGAAIISDLADLQEWRGKWGRFKAPTRMEWSNWVKKYPALAAAPTQIPIPSQSTSAAATSSLTAVSISAYPTPTASSTTPSPTHKSGDRKPDQYIIAMHYHINPTQLKEHIDWLFSIIKSSNIFTDEQLSKFRGVVGQLECDFFHGYIGHLPSWVIELIKRDPWVRFVEEDQYIELGQSTTPSPTPSTNTSLVTTNNFLATNGNNTLAQANPPWGLDRISHREPGFKGLYAYPADGGKNVDIYILDTGVNINHTDFEGRARHGQSFSDEGQRDGNGHGTHVAGIAAGRTYGVAKAASIVSLKVLDNDGTGPISAVIAGIDWVVRNMNSSSRAVVNMSLGRGGKSQAMNDIVTAAMGRGVVFAAAAGNDDVNACGTSPADSGSVMTVGASDENDNRASFSNWGRCVDIFAPGANITSAAHTSNTATRVYSGTSQAAPHVAGMMAIVLQMFPAATPVQIYDTLRDIATKDALKGIEGHDNTRNLLLFNGVNSTNLAQEARSAGDGSNFGWGSFRDMSGGWKLVSEVAWWVWV